MDIFEGISIDDLENYDPSDSKSTLEVKSIIDDNKEVKLNKSGEEVKDDIFALDINDIANVDYDEEEETTKDNKQVKKEKPVNEGNSSSNSVLTTLAANLREAGILDELEDEELNAIADEKQLYAVIQKQIKSNEFKDLNEDQKLYLKALESGIPEDDFAQNRKNASYLKSITEEALDANKQLQIDLLYHSFLVKGFSKDEAAKFAVSTVNNDPEASKLALIARDSVIKHNDDALTKAIKEDELRKEKKVLEQKAKIADLKSKLDSSSDLVPNITINKTTKDKVFESITKPVSNDEDGNPLNEVLDMYVKDQDYKMRLHALHVLTKGFKDFSKLQAEIKTKVTKTLKEEFDNTSSRSNSLSGLSSGLTSSKIAAMLP